MKPTLSLVLLLCSALGCFSQKLAVMVPAENIIYIGLDNPLAIVVENTSCDSIRVEPDRGSISGHGCAFNYRVKEKGFVHLQVYRKKKGKWIKAGDEYLRAHSLPDPTPSVGGKYGGNISKKALIANGGMIARVLNTSFDLTYRVDSFTVCIYKKDTCLYNSIHNVGARFNNEVLTAFQSLGQQDNVVFKKIYSSYTDHQMELIPFMLVIRDE